jgi:cyclohexanecarboxyl-CoA dehydrogenase
MRGRVMLSFRFSEDQEAFRASVAGFARRELAPVYRERSREDTVPKHVLRALGGMGILGIGVPSEFGGSGAPDPITLGVAVEELGYADINVAAVVVGTSLACAQLAEAGTDSVTARWLPRLVAGDAVIALALTEPDSGSDAAALRTTARETTGGWVLNGEKTSVSHLEAAEAAIVYARAPGTTRSNGISAFLVPLDAAGIQTGRFEDMGCHPLGRGTLSFSDVFVPKEQLVGAPGSGFSTVLRHFDWSRTAIALFCLGAARASLDEAARYANERMAFGRPIAAFQGVSFQVAEHATCLEALRWLCYRALWLRQEELPHTSEAAMCKWWGPRVALRTIEAAMCIHGHGAYSTEFPLQQRYRDVFAYLVADGTAEIQKLVIATDRIGPAVRDR